MYAFPFVYPPFFFNVMFLESSIIINNVLIDFVIHIVISVYLASAAPNTI